MNIPLGYRHFVTLLGFFGFFFVYALRVNLSVALVSMVNHTAINQQQALSTSRHLSAVNGSAPSKPDICIGEHGVNGSNSQQQLKDGPFVWNEDQQGLILASFFYGYIFTQIPGGWLAGRFGGKWVFGIGIVWTCALTLLTEVAAYAGLEYLVAIRILEGIGEGVTFPAMHAMFGAWAPPLERSVLPAFCYSGTTVGVVLSFIITGYLCASTFLGGWPSAFYVFGVLGCLWFVIWCIFVSSKPEESRWISEKERDYIVAELAKEKSAKDEKMRPPWLAIFTSLPVWAIIAGHVGDNWGSYTLMTELPNYLDTVLGFNIIGGGLLSSVPYIVRAVITYLAASGVDVIRARYNIKTVYLRKLVQCTAHVSAAVLLIGAAYSGCNRTLAVTLLVIAVGMTGFAQCGYTETWTQISVGLSRIGQHGFRSILGLLFGITNMFATIPGFVSPQLAGAITNNNNTLTAWRTVFFITAGVYLAASVFYFLFASAEVQDWAKEEEEEEEEEGDQKELKAIETKPMKRNNKVSVE